MNYQRLLQPGRNIFAIGLAGLGVLCFLLRDFIIGRPPAWPEGMSLNPALAWITGGLVIAAALGILFGKRPVLAALTIAILILLLSIFRHVPKFANDWLNALKAMALFGGALIIVASYFTDGAWVISGITMNGRRRNGLVLAGSVLLSLFFIAAGYSHFKFADFIVDYLIPTYIPFRAFWTYFCGICLFAGGVGILLPTFQKLAALLSGLMVLGWFLLLHIPRFLSDVNNASDQMGLCESFTFVGIFLALAAFHAKNK